MFRGKNYKESAKLIDKATLYDAKDAFQLVIQASKAKFDETVELHVKLGVDGRHADQQVRGAIVLPNGTGKTARVLVFCKEDKVEEARCPLLGYALKEMSIDGQTIRSKYLRTETQDRMGVAGYDAGAKILTDFFATELEKFYTDELDPLGKAIIDCFRNGGTVEDYCKLTPMKF